MRQDSTKSPQNRRPEDTEQRQAPHLAAPANDRDNYDDGLVHDHGWAKSSAA